MACHGRTSTPTEKPRHRPPQPECPAIYLTHEECGLLMGRNFKRQVAYLERPPFGRRQLLCFLSARCHHILHTGCSSGDGEQ